MSGRSQDEIRAFTTKRLQVMLVSSKEARTWTERSKDSRQRTCHTKPLTEPYVDNSHQICLFLLHLNLLTFNSDQHYIYPFNINPFTPESAKSKIDQFSKIANWIKLKTNSTTLKYCSTAFQ